MGYFKLKIVRQMNSSPTANFLVNAVVYNLPQSHYRILKLVIFASR